MAANNESAPRATVVNGLIERFALRILSKLNVDATGQLRVTASMVANQTLSTVSTVSVVSNIQSIGTMSQVATMQQMTQQHFQSSYRRNLVVS